MYAKFVICVICMMRVDLISVPFFYDFAFNTLDIIHLD